MAIMRFTRPLCDSEGNSLGIDAPAGSKVEVIETDPPLIKIGLPNLPNQPVGFVALAAVDLDANATLAPLDWVLFAKRCAEEEGLYGVSAHYLMSVAQLRTNVTDASANTGGDVGPFSLSQGEWKSFSALPDFQLDYAPSDINLWRSQCAVFAVMTYLTQNKLAGLLAAQPNPSELYFAQLVGAKAAVSGFRSQDRNLSDLINSTAPADFEADGIDSTRIITRAPQLLTGTASVKDTMNLIDSAFQKALDNTRQSLVGIGAQVISDTKGTIPLGNGGIAGINFDAPVIVKTGHADMAKLIAQRFSDAGFGTVQQITAIANAIRESGLNPAAASTPPEKSFGLFQLNTASGARGFGHPSNELTDPEKNIAITLNWFAVDKSLATFKTAPDLRTAMTIFVRNFENPKNSADEISDRFNVARAIVA
jgi:hypothetical protein